MVTLQPASLWVSSGTGLDTLHLFTLHTAMHCRSFRNSSAVGTSSEPATTRATLPNVKLVWRNCCLQSCQSSAFFCCPSVESLHCLASCYLHDLSSCERCLWLRSIAGGAHSFCRFTFLPSRADVHGFCQVVTHIQSWQTVEL